MKARSKLLKTIVLFVTLASLLVSFAACTTDAPVSSGGTAPAAQQASAPVAQETQQADSAEKYRVGIVLAGTNDPFGKEFWDACEKYVKEYPDWEVVNMLDSQMDPIKAGENLDMMATQDLDLILVQCVTGAEPYLLQYNEMGVPIVLMQLEPKLADETANLQYYLAACDNTEPGKLQAEYLAGILPDDAKVCYIYGILGASWSVSRREGYDEVMGGTRPDVTILDEQTDNLDPSKTISIVNDWIQRFGADGIDAIVVQAQASCGGVVEALKAAGLNGEIPVASVDCPIPQGPEWVKEGSTAIDIFQDADAQAKAGVEMADKVLRGEDVPQRIDVPFVAVTKDNVDDFLAAHG